MSRDQDIVERLQTRFADGLTMLTSVDQPTIQTDKGMLLDVLQHLKLDEGYAMCLDVTAVDWFPSRPRFEVVYHFYHPHRYARLRVKTWVGEGEEMPSVVGLWPGANWPEREAFDLFGIVFTGHPNLTRIYLPDDWEGYPLRKDYPTAGNRVD